MKKTPLRFIVVFQIFCILTLAFLYNAPLTHPLQGMDAIINDIKIGISKTPFHVEPTNGTSICTAIYAQVNPQTCSDGMGGIIITWQDWRSGSTYDIYAQRINATGHPLWGANGTPICAANDNQIDPQICSDGAGGAIIIWRDRRNGVYYNIFAQRINPMGSTLWAVNGRPIFTISWNHHFNPQICSDGAGGAIITWAEDQWLGGLEIFAQRINPSGDVLWYTDGAPICVSLNDQFSPEICSDGLGGAIITWSDYRSGSNLDIYAQRINSTGFIQWWGDEGAISLGIGNQSDAAICSDGAGGAIIAWRDHRSGTLDIYAQRINAVGNTLWVTNGVAICTAVNNQWTRPQMCSDGTGGAIITWQDGRNETDYDIYAQRILAGGSVGWKANGTVICTAINNQQNPEICSDGAGGAIITWQDNRSGTNLDIYAQIINSTGIIQWTANGTVISTAVNDQLNPHICTDGIGGSFITWQDLRTGMADIYTLQIRYTEVVKWTTNGTAICTASNAQQVSQICGDGVGGAIISWQDNRSGGGYDIYAQRMNATGHPLWAINGTPICTASNNQENLQICSDGVGGAIISWQDCRSGGGYDIYAQRMNATGQILWAVNGMPICTAIGDQVNSRICSDGVGGAIITWPDGRKGADLDIYAQRINATGQVLWAVNGTPVYINSLPQKNPQICSDGAGGAIITWEDHPSSDYSGIRAQRINTTGHILWDYFGVAILDGSYYYYGLNSQICSDGVGGAIITWHDWRFGSENIYAQRINAVGTTLWTFNGIRICVQWDKDQTNPQICSDGAGGAIITWQEDRSGGGYDIYTQRILAGGSVGWESNGIMICTTVNHQINPQICSDGAGGAIITWQDSRNGGGYDIYAHHIDSASNFLWGDNGTVICTAANSQVDPKMCSDGVGGAIITWADARTGGGNDIYACRIREKDMPKILVRSPSGEFYNSPPTMDVDFTSIHLLDSGYYQVDSYLPGGFNTTGWIAIFTALEEKSYTDNFIIDDLLWDALGEGTHTVYFKTWDEMENINENILNPWQFYKDTVPPESFSIVSPTGWTANTTPTVICQFSTGLSGVNVSSVQFAYSTNGSLNPTNWAAIDGVYRDVNCTTSATDGDTGILFTRVLAVPFNQDSGTANTIRFRATDMAGNLGTQSTAAAIQIDFSPPESFSIISPAGWTADKTPTVICEFYTGLSGVNVSSVQYAYSMIRETTPTNWANVDGVYLDANCTIPAFNGATGWLFARVLEVPFSRESEVLNTIRFRATDMVNNIGIQNIAVPIQIDATGPWSFSIIFPTGKITNQTPTVICQFHTGPSGVNLSTVYYAYSTSGEVFPTNWAVTDGVYTDPYCSISASQNSTGWLYIKVEAVLFNQVSETLNTIRFRASNLAGLQGTQPYATNIEIVLATPITEEPGSILLKFAIIIGISAIAAAIIVHVLLIRSKSPKPAPPPKKTPLNASKSEEAKAPKEKGIKSK